VSGSHPNNWDRALAISTAVGALGTLFAVVAAISIADQQIRETRTEVAAQLRESRENARAQLNEARDEARMQHLVDESVRFDQPPLVLSRIALARKRIDIRRGALRPLDADNPPSEMFDVLNECDHVGILTQRGYLDVHDVWNELGYWLLNFYADAEPAVLADRKDNPDSESACSWLIEQMKPFETRYNAGRDLRLSHADLYGFYLEESKAVAGAPLPHRPSR
jgi:hypothetical protein